MTSNFSQLNALLERTDILKALSAAVKSAQRTPLTRNTHLLTVPPVLRDKKQMKRELSVVNIEFGEIYFVIVLIL